jgi:hypothetical protein
MIDLHLTAHAAIRIAQRGMRSRDLDLISLIGTKVEGGYLILEKDYQALERQFKQVSVTARRLVGKRLVIAGDRVISAYHAGDGKKRRLIRGAEKRELRD